MAGKSRWAHPLIAAVAMIGIFLVFSAGSACASKISGLVTESSGDRVAWATVTLYQNGQECLLQNNPANTDITGYYEFAQLPPGAYSLQAEKNAYYSSTNTVNLDNNDVQINLPIPGYSAMSATPTMTPDYVTITPTPAPTIKPSPKPIPTLVPLPTPRQEPGFELLLALISMGAVAAIKKYR